MSQQILGRTASPVSGRGMLFRAGGDGRSHCYTAWRGRHDDLLASEQGKVS